MIINDFKIQYYIFIHFYIRQANIYFWICIYIFFFDSYRLSSASSCITFIFVFFFIRSNLKDVARICFSVSSIDLLCWTLKLEFSILHFFAQLSHIWRQAPDGILAPPDHSYLHNPNLQIHQAAFCKNPLTCENLMDSCSQKQSQYLSKNFLNVTRLELFILDMSFLSLWYR